MAYLPALAMALAYLGLGAAGAWWMRAGGHAPWPADGLAPGAVTLAVAVGLAIGGVLHLAYRPFRDAAALQPLARVLAEAVAMVGRGNLWALLPGAVLAEEVFFRGAMHPAWGWPLASVAFGLAHFLPPRRELWPYPFLAALAGAAFSGAYVLAGHHLVAPFVAHLTANALNLRLVEPTVAPEPTDGDPDAEDGTDLD
jgi:membrane protease YdiL (CAAX protease family)